MADKFCTNCAAKLMPTMLICPNCGNKSFASTPPTQLAAMPVANLSSTTHASVSFQDQSRVTRWLVYFLYAYIATHIIFTISSIAQYQLLSDFKLGIYSSQALAVAAGESNDQRHRAISWLSLIVTLPTYILYLVWVYRANSTVRAFGAKNMRFTPGWSVGWYFIPVFWLWRPYQAMKEIWMASKNPSSWANEKCDAIVLWWWLCLVFSTFLSWAVIKAMIALNATSEIGALMHYAFLTSIDGSVDVFLGIIFLILVKRIYEMQMSYVKHHIQHSGQSNHVP